MTDDIGSPVGPIKPAPGHEMVAQFPPDVPITEVRKKVKELTGCDFHISAKIGPFIDRGSGKIDAHVEAVDDPYLNGNFRVSAVALGLIYYFGRLK